MSACTDNIDWVDATVDLPSTLRIHHETPKHCYGPDDFYHHDLAVEVWPMAGYFIRVELFSTATPRVLARLNPVTAYTHKKLVPSLSLPVSTREDVLYEKLFPELIEEATDHTMHACKNVFRRRASSLVRKAVEVVVTDSFFRLR